MAQIATITVETAGGPVDLPVYEPGDSGSNRIEAFRVQTASGPGFVPLAAVDEADRPYLRVQTANGVKAVDTSASGIPDSVVNDSFAWYPFDVYGSTQNNNFDDQSQNSNTLNNGSISGCNESINGVQAAEFDGSDDGLWSNSISDIYPLTVFLAIRMDATNQQVPYNCASDGLPTHFDYNGITSDGWGINADSNVSSSGSDANATVLTVRFANSNNDALIRQDGTTVASGSAGSGRPANVISIGSESPRNSRRFFDGAIGEVVVFDDVRSSNQIDEVETYLADKWGSALS